VSNVFDRLRARGEEVLTQVSNDLMSNPQFVKALQAAMRGKEKLDAAAARALKTMNVPTRSEFKRALSRIETLEEQLAALKTKTASRPAKAAAPKKAPAKKAGPRGAAGRAGA